MQNSSNRCAPDVQQRNGLDEKPNLVCEPDPFDAVWSRIASTLGLEHPESCCLCGTTTGALGSDGLCSECWRAHNAETLRP